MAYTLERMGDYPPAVRRTVTAVNSIQAPTSDPNTKYVAGRVIRALHTGNPRIRSGRSSPVEAVHQRRNSRGETGLIMKLR